MRTFRAYCPLTSIDFNEIYSLSPATSHHLAKVLRVNRGDYLEIFDGRGNCFEATVHELGKQISIKLVKSLTNDTQSPLKLCLMIAVGKGEKMDWMIQKATELGIHTIQPVITARCEVRLPEERWQKKYQHWQEIIINACEQSGYNNLPLLQPICSLAMGLQSDRAGLKLLLHPNSGSQKLRATLANAVSETVSLLIGPEGGFEQKEITLAETHGFKLASLGPRILRMETAAIVSIALAQALLGDI
jgi:16S rRNA (uracil1498-N3)-methyltransferase